MSWVPLCFSCKLIYFCWFILVFDYIVLQNTLKARQQNYTFNRRYFPSKHINRILTESDLTDGKDRKY
jgi:hypothetical protein